MIEKQKEIIKSLNRQLEKEEYKLYIMENYLDLDDKPQTIGGKLDGKDVQFALDMPKKECW